MSIITETSPKSVIIGRSEVPVSWDFRSLMQIESMLLDQSVEGKVRVYNVLVWFYGQERTDRYILRSPALLNEAVERLLWFYRCGEDEVVRKKAIREPKRVYDFTTDAKLIYAAFLTQYHIDLGAVKHMHWWKFRSLFEALKGTTFNEVMRCRAVKVNAKTPKDQKEYYRRMKELYPLPDSKRAGRENDALVEALLSGDVEAIEKAKRGVGNGSGDQG